MRPDQDVMNRIKESFEILQAPYYRTSMIVTRGGKCGPILWQQHHHKARDALRSATKNERKFTSPGEKTAKFQDHSSIEQSYWNQKLTTMEKLLIFDDEDNEELEHDVHIFVDKTTHLTTAVLRRGVEMSML